MSRGKWSKRYRLCCVLAVLSCMVAGLCTGCKSDKPTQEISDSQVTGSVTPGSGEETDDSKEPALSEEAQKIYQYVPPKQGDLCAEIVIRNYGSLYVKLFSADAPKAVENFTTLAKQGVYDGIKISQIIEEYMFQAGDKDGTGASGDSIYGGGFRNEITERLLPVRGSLCMANEGENGTNTNQFFFVQTPARVLQELEEPLDNRYHMTLIEYFKEAYETTITKSQLEHFMTYGGAPWLTGHHTVFGQIYQGYDVLDEVMKAKVTSKLKPNPSVYIDTIRIFTYES